MSDELLAVLEPGAHETRPDQTLPWMVARHALHHPDSLAIERGADRLTYAELDCRADRLARRLAACGVRPGAMVGVHLGRSIEWVLAMLATLKAGAVCLSLDPDAPADRLIRAIEATHPALVLGGRSAQDDRLAQTVPLLLLDLHEFDDWPDQDPQGDAAGSVRVQLDDFAFAMHTSGSSGRPKIVLAQHSWLAHGAREGAAINKTSAADRGSWLGPAGAGIAVNEVGGLLWSGASIHIAEQEVIGSPPDLRDWLLATGITQAFVVTPLGELLTRLDWPDRCDLRIMTLGGAKLNRWAPAGLPFEVGVSYGSLEAFQVANSLHPWESRRSPGTATPTDLAAPPPVGRPLPGVDVHLLDEDLAEVAGDALGEFWVDSPALALGYLGEPALTADRFRPNPFGAPGTRLYRSADAGRRRPDGVLEHHGRMDEVVKVRGYRVELGEVEWALGGHPDVTQVCVAPVTDEEGRTDLVACFVGTATAQILRDYLDQRLPGYMIPVAYVRMDRLPVNTSDKIDRLALPPADWRGHRPERGYRAPRGEVAARLAELIAGLLGVHRVGADDNFLRLGGDSLLAAKLQAGIEQEYGIRIDLREVFTAEDLTELAERVAAARAGGAHNVPLPRITPRAR
ncbi:MAG TPA: non-ribosomal peptide synthetase [Actinocrinis sp.]|nr:non-ribosomal peptide synthetase [Actinocrinis sp.]